MPDTRSGRIIATADLTGYARGAAAVAEGVKDLGRGVSSFGSSLARTEAHEKALNDELEAARFASQFSVEKLKTDSGITTSNGDEEGDDAGVAPVGPMASLSPAAGGVTRGVNGIVSQPEVVADPNQAPTGIKSLDTHVDTLRARRDALLETISDPRKRELYRLKTEDNITQSNILAQKRANAIGVDRTLASWQQQGQTVIANAVQSDDPQVNAEAISAHRKQIYLLADKNLIKHQTAVKLDQEWKNNYGEAYADALVRKGKPDQAISELEAASLKATIKPSRTDGPRSEGGLNQKRIAQIDANPAISSAIEQAAARHGIDPNYAKVVANIESGGNPGAKTGSYIGVFQISRKEMAEHGAGDPTDVNANADVFMQRVKGDMASFKKATGRDPSPTELYMSHQQGRAGVLEHVNNPDQPAWQSMYATGEGQQKGVGWAKKAIWGNIPDDVKAKFGNVENVTSGDLMAIYAAKVRGTSQAQAPGQPYRVASVDGSTPAPTGEQSLPGEKVAANETQQPATIFDHMDPLAREKLLLHVRSLRNAQLADEERQQRIQQKAIQAESDKEETEVLKNLYSDNPTTSIQDIVRNEKMTREARERMIGVATRANKPDPLAEVSRRTSMDILSRMRLPEGDPQKITDVQPVYESYIAGNLNRTDLEFLKKEFSDARTPEGQSINEKKKDFERSVKPLIDKSNPLMGVIDESGAQQLYQFNFDMDRKIEQYRKEGKNPHDLFDPSKPDFLGKPEAIAPYQKTLQQSLQDQVRSLTVPAPNAGSKVQTTTPRPARNPGETADQYLKRLGVQ